MKKTVISLTDTVLTYETLDPASYSLMMTLDELARIVDINDQSRVILFAKYGYKIPSNICGVLKALPDHDMPSHIQGVFKCGT